MKLNNDDKAVLYLLAGSGVFLLIFAAILAISVRCPHA
jgi:hypothetical protein